MKKNILITFLLTSLSAFSQENYEIQVYASPTMEKGSTMFELHSNFTFNGEKDADHGVRPSYHALHETLEITHGFSKNFEIGFYLFSNYTSPYGYTVIGTHIRPRIRVPEKWNWPAGVSLSAEFGFQSHYYSADTRSLEIRPIIDKQFANFYLSFNPVIGIVLKGTNKDHTPSFSRAFKASYTFKKLALGAEYYGDIGQLDQVPAAREQSHTLFIVADLFINPDWEFNFGPGLGLTKTTDQLVFKILAGRRINWKKQKKTN